MTNRGRGRGRGRGSKGRGHEIGVQSRGSRSNLVLNDELDDHTNLEPENLQTQSNLNPLVPSLPESNKNIQNEELDDLELQYDEGSTNSGYDSPYSREPKKQTGRSSRTRRGYNVPDDPSQRPWIEPEGNGFDKIDVARKVTHVLKGYIGPWHTWRKVPEDVKETMFAKFNEYYQWLPEHEPAIKKSWSKMSGKNLSNMFNDAREAAMKAAKSKNPLKMKGNGPKWLSPADWDKLVDEVFATDEWKRRSDSARSNRLTEKYGCVTKHIGGSIPIREHEKRMKRVLGDENVSEIDVFVRTHKIQRGKGDFADNRSKSVPDAIEDVRSEKNDDDDSIHQEFDHTSWMEALAGGSSKSCADGFAHDQHTNEVLKLLKKKNEVPRTSPANNEVPRTSHANNEMPRTPHANNDVPRTSHANNEIPRTSHANNDVPRTSHSNNDVPKTSHSNNDVPRTSHANIVVPRTSHANNEVSRTSHANNEVLRNGFGHNQHANEVLSNGFGQSQHANEVLRNGFGQSEHANEVLRNGFGQSEHANEVLRNGFGQNQHVNEVPRASQSFPTELLTGMSNTIRQLESKMDGMEKRFTRFIEQANKRETILLDALVKRDREIFTILHQLQAARAPSAFEQIANKLAQDITMENLSTPNPQSNNSLFK